MNNLDKTFTLPFYNSFVKIELNSDRDIILILNTRNFRKNILPNLFSDLLIEKMCS